MSSFLMAPRTDETVFILNFDCHKVVEKGQINHKSPSFPTRNSLLLNLLQSAFPQHLIHFLLRCVSLDKLRAAGRELFGFLHHRWEVVETQYLEQSTSTIECSTLSSANIANATLRCLFFLILLSNRKRGFEPEIPFLSGDFPDAENSGHLEHDNCHPTPL